MLVARALDHWWDELGQPDPFTMVEAGAGNGRLWREVRRALPRSAAALQYMLVERSATLRARIPIEPGAATLEDLPDTAVTGVVFANELLDNLPFGVLERTADGWAEVRVDLGFTEQLAPIANGPDLDVPVGTRVPAQRAVEEWIMRAANTLQRGVLVLIDYGAPLADLVRRGGWLRTYRAHSKGSAPLLEPGSQDITTDVATDLVHAAATRAGLTPVLDTTQAQWLRSLGIDDLVAEGQQIWEDGAARGDLEAVAGRSRATEAAALVDPAGLGAHRVLIYSRP